MDTEYIPEKDWSQGQTDPSAASWNELLLNCSSQRSIHCMAEFNSTGYILPNFSLLSHL